MAFQTKDFLSIVASMINHVRGVTTKLTDFNVGSVNRAMLEAPAVEIDEMYQQMFHGLNEAIPTAIYSSLGFDRLTATPATVDLTFSMAVAPTSPVIIPIGTACRVPGSASKFLTNVQATIPVLGTAQTVRATSDTPGIVGNVLAASITEMVSAISGVTVNNPAASTGGKDLETDDARRLRFNEFILTLSRGPAASIGYGAKTAVVKNAAGSVIESVLHASVYEPYLTDSAQPLGYVSCYIFNGSGAASSTLINEAQRIVDGYYRDDGTPVMGWKASGIVCTVATVTLKVQVVTAVLTMEPGYTLAGVTAAVQLAINDYITSIPISKPLVRHELIARIMAIPGIYNCSVSAPAADVTALPSEKIVTGAITLT